MNIFLDFFLDLHLMFSIDAKKKNISVWLFVLPLCTILAEFVWCPL